jgi:mannosyltransferase OCH1-like enzyme
MCLRSWEKYVPDYQKIECNKENVDIDGNLYAKEAYSVKRYAFVSDFARLYLLYHYGGIYLDIDVELLKNLNNFLNTPAFAGYEDGVLIGAHLIGSEKKGKWVKELLECYEDRHFLVNGKHDLTMMPRTITDRMVKKGLKQDDSLQIFDNLVHIYPKEYFSPKDWRARKTKEIKLTENSYCIHHWADSWWTKTDEIKRKIFKLKQRLANISQ